MSAQKLYILYLTHCICYQRYASKHCELSFLGQCVAGNNNNEGKKDPQQYKLQ